MANALLGVSLGCTQVQGTINGYGERCGNGNLTSIIPAVVSKMGMEAEVGKHIDKLYFTSRLINELANLPHNRYQPYVGESAFAHKGGIHVSAVQRNPLTYEHIEPEKVGNIRRILISDQAGKSNVLHKAVKYGLNLKADDPAMTKIVQELKELENQGFQYEGAEASFELLMRRAMGLKTLLSPCMTKAKAPSAPDAGSLWQHSTLRATGSGRTPSYDRSTPAPSCPLHRHKHQKRVVHKLTTLEEIV